MLDEWKKGAKYWEYAWNPVIGCRKISAGCQNCYAESMSNRFPELQDENGNFTPHAPKKEKSAPRNGVVFVGNMTDIFGEWNNNEDICRWIGSLHPVTAMNIILTKRAERMESMIHNLPKHGNFLYGVTAENQDTYNQRIKSLRAVSPYIHTWLSVEPLLGPIDLGLDCIAPEDLPFCWVVIGAESGTNRRPCKVEWVESIARQCVVRGIKVFVKQLDLDGKLEKDIEKFPKSLQIREIPWEKK